MTVQDAATGAAAPVRVRLTDAAGATPSIDGALPEAKGGFGAPPEALPVFWGRQDRPEGWLLQPDGAFYVDGAFTLDLPPGEYRLELTKGYEYVGQTHALSISAGETLERDYLLDRWIDSPARGWYSADDHIHLRRSPRDNPNILRWIAAEDLHVGNILQMGDFWAYYFSQYAFGEKGRYQEGDRLLSPGQEEPRTPEFGHTISLGADEFVRMQRDYYSYDKLFDRVHELGGISGFAHQGMSFHGYRGMTVNVVLGKIDFLELLQFCVADGPIHTEHYYRFLDMGFPLTALAGSDFPWCGRGSRTTDRGRASHIGDARFYAYLGSGRELTFERWMAALKAGRTFATTGPVLDLRVNGKPPGERLDVAPGEKLNVVAQAFGHAEQVPLSKLEIIVHGEARATAKPGTRGQSAKKLEAQLELTADGGVWIAARADAGPTQIAHTTPVYVSVDGGGFHNPATLEPNLQRSEADLRSLEEELENPGDQLDNQARRHRAELERQIAETRAALDELRSRLTP